MQVAKIIATKGRTKEEDKEWKKQEYTVEAILNNGENPETARQQLDSMLEKWLNGKPSTFAQNTPSQITKKCKNCGKQIDPKYTLCYSCLQKVRNKS